MVDGAELLGRGLPLLLVEVLVDHRVHVVGLAVQHDDVEALRQRELQPPERVRVEERLTN